MSTVNLALQIMGQGMVGIFTAIIIIMIVLFILKSIPQKKNDEETQS